MCSTRNTRSRCSARCRWGCRFAVESRCTAVHLGRKRRRCRHCTGSNMAAPSSAIVLPRYTTVVEAANTVSNQMCKRRTGRWQRRQGFRSGLCSRCRRHISRIDCSNRAGSPPGSPCQRHRCLVRPQPGRRRWAHRGWAHRGWRHREGCPRAARPEGLPTARRGGSPRVLRRVPRPPGRREKRPLALGPARNRRVQGWCPPRRRAMRTIRLYPTQRHQGRRSRQIPARPARPQPRPLGRDCRGRQEHRCRHRQPSRNGDQPCIRTPAGKAVCRRARRCSSPASSRTQVPVSRVARVPAPANAQSVGFSCLRFSAVS
jgi:hypothetical protein